MELSKRLYAKYEPPANGITPETKMLALLALFKEMYIKSKRKVSLQYYFNPVKSPGRNCWGSKAPKIHSSDQINF